MVGQFLGKITSWEKATAVLQKKKKGYKNPLKRIKDKEKDTRVEVLYAPFVCVLMAQRKGFEPLYELPHNMISNHARSTAPPSLQQF